MFQSQSIINFTIESSKLPNRSTYIFWTHNRIQRGQLYIISIEKSSSISNYDVFEQINDTFPSVIV